MIRVLVMDIESKKVAIVAITKSGAELGRKILEALPGSILYFPEKLGFEPGERMYPFSQTLKELIGEFFPGYRSLVLIMAAGIAVRLVAPKLENKHKDPGVVVVDEGGRFAISLVSGHEGGANELARRIAQAIGAQPVITTAEEARETISLDTLGQSFGWELEEGADLARVRAALINGEEVGIYQDAGERNWWPKGTPLPTNIYILTNLEDIKRLSLKAAIIITDRLLDQKLVEHVAIYRSKSLVVGLGYHQGVSPSHIEEAVGQLLLKHNLSPKSIRNVATIDVKQGEASLSHLAQAKSLNVEFFSAPALAEVDFPSPPSSMTHKWVGTPSVCEAAALLSSGASSLLVPKTKLGDITLAIARIPFDKSLGKLFLVGLGPGDPDYLTPRARKTLSESDVILGYRTYIELLGGIVRGKEVVSTEMGEEVKRAERAISLAGQGKTVSLVSGGDSGLYGMAGLVMEMLRFQKKAEIYLEVIPGVPALCGASSLLGAPLTSDFACISLSDRLTPWEDIERRLELSARGDMVIVLYNPCSQGRRRELALARDILLKHRGGSTPVGIVDSAYRKGQRIAITDIDHMLDFDIGMSSTVIVGNSSTFTLDKWMITPRGYSKKYNLERS